MNETEKTLEELQAAEDRNMRLRTERLLRAMKEVGHRFRQSEMQSIEAIVERAFGRVTLDK